jgi:NAD(P)-dependent dehydrogenase (short-subunit alcohol dehydrogenase family)
MDGANRDRSTAEALGQPHGVAAIAAFLASHDASYITGVEFNVDGGLGQF